MNIETVRYLARKAWPTAHVVTSPKCIATQYRVEVYVGNDVVMCDVGPTLNDALHFVASRIRKRLNNG